MCSELSPDIGKRSPVTNHINVACSLAPLVHFESYSAAAAQQTFDQKGFRTISFAVSWMA